MERYLYKESLYIIEKEIEIIIVLVQGDVAELKDLISAEDVINAVRSYIEDVSVEGPMSAAAAGGKATDEDNRIGQKRLNSMRNFWIQLSQIVSDESVGVWKQLERDSIGLRELLNKRSAAIAEVDSLTQRNAELKVLLNQYLGDAAVNSALQVPPAQVMRVKNIPTATAANKGATGSNKKAGGKGGGNKVLLSQTH